jgi:hypothetical protein
MWQKPIFVFCLIALSCSFGFSQKRTVTNADLEAYKQKRLQAEQDYRENYARLGFPSPEELDRRREESLKRSEELSAKLRSERLERERLEAARRAMTQSSVVYPSYYPYGYDNTIYSGAWFNPYSFGRRHFFPGGRFPGSRFPVQAGYFAGGQFWPPPVGTHVPQTIIHFGGGHGFHGGGGHGGGGGGPRR